MGTVDVCIGNNLIIDFDIYSSWVDGLSVDECKEKILRLDPSSRDVSENIVLKDIVDHYFIFNKLEQYLQTPTRLKEQLLFQISNEILEQLIEKYYNYDSNVMREILSHKLTQRQRKDLDDIGEKTEVRVRSCRRQFDNLRRIIRVLDDLKGTLFKNIQENFCLSHKACEDYSSMVFLARNQFELSKKKLAHLSLEDFLYCANQIIKNWPQSNSFENDSDLSRDFLLNLKELRILIEKDFIDDHKKLVLTSINKSLNLNSISNAKLIQIFDYLFKDLSKSLIEIAYNLNHSKDLKDLFFDLVENFIEPCKEQELSKNEVKLFLDEYKKKAHQLHDICRDNPKLLTILDKYLFTISNLQDRV